MMAAAATGGERRLEQLYGVSKLLTAFASIEETVGAALEIVAATLPLESAILFVAVMGGRTDMTVWHSDGGTPDRRRVAKAHAEDAYAYLVGARSVDALELREERGMMVLPAPVDRSPQAQRFIVIPLVVGRGGVFGALQLEGATRLDRDDLEFVNAITNQLAIALDRDRMWRHDVLRRREAQLARAKYESLVDHLEHAFVWEADVETRRLVYASAQVERMLDLSLRQCLDEPNWWRVNAHPDDLPLLEHMFARARAVPGDQRCDHRRVLADGSVRWFQTSVHLAGGAGEPPRFEGVSFDVTDARAAQERVREQLSLSNAMAGSLGEGAVAIDLDARVTFINEAAASLLGCETYETRGKRSGEILQTANRDGRVIECPLASAMRTGTSVRSEDHVFVRADGTRFPATFTAAPIRQDGRVTGAVLAFDDISERRATQDAERFLLDAGAKLNASLFSAAVFGAIAQVGVPRLGDICLVDIISTEDQPSRVAWAHRDPALQGELDRVFGGAAPAGLLSEPVLDVIATGRSLRVPIVAGAWFCSDDLPIARVLGIRSALIVPVAIGARQLGTLTFCRCDDGEPDARTIALAEELARRSALAVEHARLYEQARHAIAARDQTLAIVSHDLRTPLSTIVMASSILGDDEMARASRWTKTAVVEKIQNAAGRMERLIGDLLDFANIEAGRLAIETGPQDGASIVAESAASFEDVARKRGVGLRSEAQAGMPFVQCDRDRVLQVIANLVGNALAIVHPAGSICLGVKTRGDEAVFSISDSGPGIAAAEQRRLFDRYWRGSQSGYKGTGLGLAIARGIVEAHGGRIWVDSELGHGATFFFTIPLAAALPRAASSDSR